MNAEVLALYAATFSVAFFHTMSPDHWMPFVMFGKAKKWPIIKTELVALLAGIGHVGTSVIIAVVGIVIGSEISKNFASIAEVVTGIALILFGFGYAIYMWSKGGHVHFTIGGKYLAKSLDEHEHSHSEGHEHGHADEQPHTHTHADGSVHVDHAPEASAAPQAGTHVHADGSVHVNHTPEASAAPQAGTHVHADGSVHVNHTPEASAAPQAGTHVHADGSVHVNHTPEASAAPKPGTHVHADGSVHVNHIAESSVALQTNTAGEAHFAEIHSHVEEPHTHGHDHEHGEPHGHSHEGEHGHVHAQEAKSPYALVLIMGLTPCIALLPMAFAASTFGTGVTVVTILIFATSTLVPILGLTFLGSLGLAKLKLGWFEKYGDIITGVVIGCIGLMTMLLGL